MNDPLPKLQCRSQCWSRACRISQSGTNLIYCVSLVHFLESISVNYHFQQRKEKMLIFLQKAIIWTFHGLVFSIILEIWIIWAISKILIFVKNSKLNQNQWGKKYQTRQIQETSEYLTFNCLIHIKLDLRAFTTLIPLLYDHPL